MALAGGRTQRNFLHEEKKKKRTEIFGKCYNTSINFLTR